MQYSALFIKHLLDEFVLFPLFKSFLLVIVFLIGFRYDIGQIASEIFISVDYFNINYIGIAALLSLYQPLQSEDDLDGVLGGEWSRGGFSGKPPQLFTNSLDYWKAGYNSFLGFQWVSAPIVGIHGLSI